MTDQQNNPSGRYQDLIEEARGIAGLNEVFVSWLQDLADHIARQELSHKEASERLRKLADEMKNPDGRPDQYVESLKMGQIFLAAGEEERDPEPLLVDFIKQLEEQQ